MSASQTPGSNQSGQDITGKVKDMAGDLKSKAAEVTADLTEATKHQASEIATTAREFASDATSKAQSAIAEQKSIGADYVASVAGAVQRAAGEFESEVPFAARYLRQTAEQIESVADTVRNRDLKELVGEVESFARRQPAMFFGGAMLLGFAALRFLKSAPEGYSHDRSASAPAAPPKVHSPSMDEFDQDVRNNTYKGA